MNKSLNARLTKLETALAVREVMYLVRHEHTDDNDQTTGIEWPEGISSEEEAARLYPDKAITWIVVRHVEYAKFMQ